MTASFRFLLKGVYPPGINDDPQEIDRNWYSVVYGNLFDGIKEYSTAGFTYDISVMSILTSRLWFHSNWSSLTYS